MCLCVSVLLLYARLYMWKNGCPFFHLNDMMMTLMLMTTDNVTGTIR